MHAHVLNYHAISRGPSFILNPPLAVPVAQQGEQVVAESIFVALVVFVITKLLRLFWTVKPAANAERMVRLPSSPPTIAPVDAPLKRLELFMGDSADGVIGRSVVVSEIVIVSTF